jgi:DNA-binding MarR family transcriptional regulator
MSKLQPDQSAFSSNIHNEKPHARSPGKKLHMNLTSLTRELDTAASKLLKPYSLTPTRFDILEELLLYENGLTQAEIARSLRVQPANILAALKPLLERGWVRREKDEGNKKEKLIYMNAEYKTRFLEIVKIYNVALDKLFTDLPPENLEEWLRRMRQRLGRS